MPFLTPRWRTGRLLTSAARPVASLQLWNRNECNESPPPDGGPRTHVVSGRRQLPPGGKLSRAGMSPATVFDIDRGPGDFPLLPGSISPNMLQAGLVTTLLVPAAGRLHSVVQVNPFVPCAQRALQRRTRLEIDSLQG